MNISQLKAIVKSNTPITVESYNKFLKDNVDCKEIKRSYLKIDTAGEISKVDSPTSISLNTIMIDGKIIQISVCDLDEFIAEAIDGLAIKNINTLKSVLVGNLYTGLLLCISSKVIECNPDTRINWYRDVTISIDYLNRGEIYFKSFLEEESIKIQISENVLKMINLLKTDVEFIDFKDPNDVINNTSNIICAVLIVMKDGYGVANVSRDVHGNYVIKPNCSKKSTLTLKSCIFTNNIIREAVANKTPLDDYGLKCDITESIKMSVAIDVALDANIQLNPNQITVVEGAGVFAAGYVSADKEYAVTFDVEKAYQEESAKLNVVFDGLDFPMTLKM